MKYLPLNPEIFIQNRKSLPVRWKKIQLPFLTAMMNCPQMAIRCYPFKQNADLFWLTGIEQEDSYAHSFSRIILM